MAVTATLGARTVRPMTTTAVYRECSYSRDGDLCGREAAYRVTEPEEFGIQVTPYACVDCAADIRAEGQPGDGYSIRSLTPADLP